MPPARFHPGVIASKKAPGLQKAEGQFAQSYNRRKGRTCAFWGDRYHCTIIEERHHLWSGMAYIELNTVRVGVVAHPAQWPWCSYREWMGQRQRYLVIDAQECLKILGGAGLEEFRANYQATITDRLAKAALAREPQRTESIAVGSRALVGAFAETISYSMIGESAWVLREAHPSLLRSLRSRVARATG